MAKTKVMVESATASPTIVFTCNGRPVYPDLTFKYLGAHFDTSGNISHLITPLRAKAAGS